MGSVNEFMGARNPVVLAVKALIDGSHLSNNDVYFMEVEQAVTGAVNSASTRYPFVTATCDITGGDDDLVFVTLTVGIYGKVPVRGDHVSDEAHQRAIRLLKERQQLDVVEIKKWLTGERHPVTRKPLYGFMSNGAFTVDTATDPLDEDIPEGRSYRLMETLLTLPLRGPLGDVALLPFNPPT